MGAYVIERCGFLLCDLRAAAAAHLTSGRQLREESKRELNKTAELEQAQVAAASEAGSLRKSEAAANALRQDIYDAALDLFELNKNASASPAERDNMWNEAEAEAANQSSTAFFS